MIFADHVHHKLLHQEANLSDAIAHLDPSGTSGDPRALTSHHRGGV